jgi:hypothetical protein
MGSGKNNNNTNKNGQTIKTGNQKSTQKKKCC